MTGMKQQHAGYRSSLKLQKQVAHLKELIEQEQQAAEDTRAKHMLLANAILLHRVTHEFMHPLYQQWAQEDATADRPGDAFGRLSQLPLVKSHPNWELLVQIATSTSNMTRRLLSVTPERVRTLAGFTLQDAWQLTKECATGMILLSELLLPARYPSGLLTSGPVSTGATDPGSPTAPAEVTEAAQQLLARLQQYQALIHKYSISVSVLLGLQPTTLIGLAGMDLDTGQPCSPPAGHFLQAAKRLGLTRSQVTELMRIRQLSNRMVSQVRSTGLQLVGQAADSFGVLTSLSSAPTSSTPATTAAQSGGPSTQQPVVSLASSEQQDEVGVDDAVLQKLMQRHVHNLADFLLVVQGNWVINVLTPWQHGLYAAASWPFQASMGALVELAPTLRPDGAAPLHINKDACQEAAAAAALGAELGYTGAQQSMQHRHDAMDAHLAWVLHELGLLQQ